MKANRITASLSAALIAVTVAGSVYASADSNGTFNGNNGTFNGNNGTFNGNNSTFNDNNGVFNGTTNTGTTTLGSTTLISNPTIDLFNNCVKVSWKAVSDASSYLVMLYDSKGNLISNKSISGNSTACTISLSEFNLTYYDTGKFYINVWSVPRNTVLNSGFLTVASGTSAFTVKGNMSAYPSYGCPKNIKCEIVNGQVNVTWESTAITTKSSKVKDIYTVSVIEVSSNKSVFNATTTDLSQTVKGLKNGVKYRIDIFNQSYSASASIEYTYKTAAGTTTETKDPKKLTAPTNLKAKADDGEILLTWSKVKDADGYRVYMYDSKTGKYKTYKTVKGTQCTIDNLKNGKSYKFRVAAVIKDPKTEKYKAGPSSSAISAKPKN